MSAIEPECINTMTAQSACLQSTARFTPKQGLELLTELLPLIDDDTNLVGPIPGDELPVRPDLRDDEDRDLGLEFGVPPTKTGAVRVCQNALILSLIEALKVGLRGVHYSRDRNYYADLRETLPKYWTYTNVIRAVENLVQVPEVFADARVAPQDPNAPEFVRRRSAIYGGPLLQGTNVLPNSFGAPVLPVERIIVRNRYGRSKPLARNAGVAATEKFLARYDRAVEAATITLEDQNVIWLSPSVGMIPVKAGCIRFDLRRRRLVRIFNLSIGSGGRWYRVFWQQMPEKSRRGLRIDGAPTFEHDFANCHLRLAYYGADAADKLARFGDSDLYRLAGWGAAWRKLIKTAVQILFNARSFDEALCAIAAKLPGRNWERRIGVAGRLISAIKHAHPALGAFWHSRVCKPRQGEEGFV